MTESACFPQLLLVIFFRERINSRLTRRAVLWLPSTRVDCLVVLWFLRGREHTQHVLVSWNL